jgi:hypothetical protein
MPSPRKTGPKKAAHRPYKPIDWKLVDKYLKAGCNGIQIAAKFNMHCDTFYQRVEIEKKVGFTEYSSSKKSDGEADLLLQQFEDALGIAENKGNTQLLLRLGEERLGQGKKSDQSSPDEGRIAIILLQKIDRLESRLQSLGLSESALENKQSLLDQGQPGQQNQVQTELGTATALGRSSPMQDNPESSSAGNNDVFVPDFTR